MSYLILFPIQYYLFKIFNQRQLWPVLKFIYDSYYDISIHTIVNTMSYFWFQKLTKIAEKIFKFSNSGSTIMYTVILKILPYKASTAINYQ